MESESTRVTEHVNSQVRAVQRAFGVLADTLEDEVGNLRAADAQQWEQLKVHATQFNEVEVLKTELDRTRNDLRAFQSAFAAFKTDEYGAMARKVEELTQESMEQREQLSDLQKAHTAEKNRLVEEVTSLRRWRSDVAGPFIESAGRSVAHHEQQIERTLPAVQKLLEEVDGRTSKHLPELIHAADATSRRQQYLEEEGARTAAQLARLAEAHTESSARFEERLRLFRDEGRTESESHELRLRQAASELETHADALRQLAAESAKHRLEAREEADTIATAVCAAQARALEDKDITDKAMSELRASVKEIKDSSVDASRREAEQLESVLNLKTQSNQMSAWMDHVQRELTTSKQEATRATELLRDMAGDGEALRAHRAAWKEELAFLDGKMSDMGRSVDGFAAETQAIRELTASMEVFKREVRSTFEASQHAHNRLRELVDERSRGADGSGPLYSSTGPAAAREAEANAHASRSTVRFAAEHPTPPFMREGSIQRLREEGTLPSKGSPLKERYVAAPESSVLSAGDGSSRGGGSPDLESNHSKDPQQGSAVDWREGAIGAGLSGASMTSERPLNFAEVATNRAFMRAWDLEHLEPPSTNRFDRAMQQQNATRSPPISKGSGPAAFTPSLWRTPSGRLTTEGGNRAPMTGDPTSVYSPAAARLLTNPGEVMRKSGRVGDVLRETQSGRFPLSPPGLGLNRSAPRRDTVG